MRQRLRRWLGVETPAPPDTSGTARNVRALLRQIAELKGLVQQQSAFTEEALHRAGWQSAEEVRQQAALHRALHATRTRGDLLVGPWTGEVGFELLYWIPFLGWLVEQGVDPSRMVVISRGGAGVWYRHLTDRYVDVLDLMTPDEFRERTAGKKKQYDEHRELDREIVERARTALALPDATLVHPSAMFRLFSGLWRKRATVDLVEAFASFRPLAALPPAAGAARPSGLPDDYVAAKFYFSQAFPATEENSAFVGEVLRRVSRQLPVVLLSTEVRLDEHADVRVAASHGVYVVDSHAVPSANLERQSQLIASARGFIGTYGGFSYLAPLYGVPSLSFFSRRNGFESHHLDLANRVFDRVLPGGFLALDRRAASLVDPMFEQWAARRRPVPAEA